jgi:hypothetical protein
MPNNHHIVMILGLTIQFFCINIITKILEVKT